jgi:hypothetical protein
MTHPLSVLAPRRSVRALALMVALATIACAHAYKPYPVNTAERGLVFGHIDTPKPLEAVQLAKVMSISRPSAAVTTNGDFFFHDVEPGHYALMQFMYEGKWHVVLTGDKDNNKQFIVDVKPGTTHYLGAYRVTGESHSFMKGDQFGLERMGKPGEREIFQRIRPLLVGTGWEKR